MCNGLLHANDLDFSTLRKGVVFINRVHEIWNIGGNLSGRLARLSLSLPFLCNFTLVC
jgi:hypothetical protein